eukprot:COSAG01_NODE_2564_length_7448_cov_10.275238_6_plen_124_part_00
MLLSDGGVAPGLRLLSPPPGHPLCSSIVSFSLPLPSKGSEMQPAAAVGGPCMTSDELAEMLKTRYRIVVKTHPHHSAEEPAGNETWRNAVRLSLHMFNTAEDVQRLLRALRQVFGDVPQQQPT